VACACPIPSYAGVSWFQTNLGKNRFVRLHLSAEKLGMIAGACFPTTAESITWTKEHDPISKVTRPNRAGGAAK
jgi:hypothetical protein